MSNFIEIINYKTESSIYLYEGNSKVSGNKEEVEIINNIPCFYPIKTFENHWKENATEKIPISKIKAANNFLDPLVKYQNEIGKELKILDAGCGDGIHLYYLSKDNDVKKYHSKLVGTDLSIHALKVCKNRLEENNIHLVQSNIAKLPFKDNYFDAVFSYGVIAYTDNPEDTFYQLIRKTKKNGIIGIWMAPKKYGISGFIFKIIRGFCRLTGKIGSNIIANTIVPFMSIIPTNSGVSLKNATWNQCKEVILVNIAPTKIYFPDNAEVKKWFNNSNIRIIKEDSGNPILLWGIKE